MQIMEFYPHLIIESMGYKNFKSLLSPVYINIEPCNIYFWVSGINIAHFNRDYNLSGHLLMNAKMIDFEINTADARKSFIPLLLGRTDDEHTYYELWQILKTFN